MCSPGKGDDHGNSAAARWWYRSTTSGGNAPSRCTIWVDETTLHVLLDGTRLKTLPSRLGVIELARLAADGACPAGPPPLVPASSPNDRSVTAETSPERLVNDSALTTAVIRVTDR